MPLSPDILIARRRWRRQARLWRWIAFFALVIVAVALLDRSGSLAYLIKQEHIVRLKLNGFIEDDPFFAKSLESIAANKQAKALLVVIDSPGGTSVGGESLYRNLRRISDTDKPVVAVIRTVGTSAAYVTALGADRIYALETSVLGSIGAIVQHADLTRVLDRLGIQSEVYRSGDLKALPSPFETTPPNVRVATQNVVDDVHQWLIDTVSKRRKLSRQETAKIARGQIFTGRQALKMHLIDGIGGETEAVSWLETAGGLSPDLPILEANQLENRVKLVDLLFNLHGKTSFLKRLSLDGVLSVWHAGAN